MGRNYYARKKLMIDHRYNALCRHCFTRFVKGPKPKTMVDQEIEITECALCRMIREDAQIIDLDTERRKRHHRSKLYKGSSNEP